MRWVLFACLLIPARSLAQQAPASAVPSGPPPPDATAGAQEKTRSPDDLSPGGVFSVVESSDAPLVRPGAETNTVTALFDLQDSLPDSPGSLQAGQDAGGSGKPPRAVVPCVDGSGGVTTNLEAQSARQDRTPCAPETGIYKQFLNSPLPLPLTSRQKGILAIRDVIDPFNLMTITLNAAFTVGIDPHNAYGPGMMGFGRDIGYSLAQDASGEFIGTYVVCSLAHQDPHYHRDPEAPPMTRLLHALRHTIVSQHDDGRPMPNYENFITYPASALLSNVYVPGVHGNGPSTVARIVTGLATDPVNNIITEFLPDFARHIHVRVVFVQQIVNGIATGEEM